MVLYEIYEEYRVFALGDLADFERCLHTSSQGFFRRSRHRDGRSRDCGGGFHSDRQMTGEVRPPHLDPFFKIALTSNRHKAAALAGLSGSGKLSPGWFISVFERCCSDGSSSWSDGKVFQRLGKGIRQRKKRKNRCRQEGAGQVGEEEIEVALVGGCPRPRSTAQHKTNQVRSRKHYGSFTSGCPTADRCPRRASARLVHP